MRWLSLAVLISVAELSTADDGRKLLGQSVSVENVHLAAASTGADTEIRFRVHNHSGASLVFLGVETELARGARLQARVDDDVWVETSAVTLAGDSITDFGSSHLRVVLEGMKSDTEPGASVGVGLRFVQGTLVVQAIVVER